ncbi:MAG: hypothetical protein ABII12_04610 [Planctomycetota bacterium]
MSTSPAGNSPSSKAVAGYVIGFLLVVAGALAAVLPHETWARWLAFAGEPWTGEFCRWGGLSLLFVAGVSFLPSRPIFVLLTSASFLLVAYGVDAMTESALAESVEGIFGSGLALAVAVVGSLALGYLVHTAPRVAPPRVRGIIGLLLVALAGLGTVHGWYDTAISSLAPKLGSGVAEFVSQWSEECTWAVALILTAVGAASSRTRPIHFLVAILLGALAYYCVHAGMEKVVVFPEFGKSLPEVSWKNVELWRWVAAGELVLLGMILLYQALGIGGFSVATAFAWMLVALSLYASLGSFSGLRFLSSAVSGHWAGGGGTGSMTSDSLSAMGMPVQQSDDAAATTTSGMPPATTSRTSAGGAHAAPILSSANPATDRQRIVGEVTRQTWLLVTAILAGVIGITGLRMLSLPLGLRLLLLCGLWVATALGVAALCSIAPDRGEGKLELWLVLWTQSKCHVYGVWVAFIATMAVAGSWAMLGKGTGDSWAQASIYAIFAGTLLSLLGVTVLIRFGGFPPLPIWTYVAIAVGQSYLAWVLLMHLSTHARRGWLRTGSIGLRPVQ